MNKMEEFSDCPETVYLTGSRYFKPWGLSEISSTTDYDYAVQDTPRVRTYLKAKGFEEAAKSPQYLDIETTAIFKKDNIDVILKRDIELYNKVMEALSKEFYVRYLWKSGPYKPDKEAIQNMINALFTIVRAVTGQKG